MAAAWAGCAGVEEAQAPDSGLPSTPHEAYEASLVAAGLGGTALADRWRSAAESALAAPVELRTPFEEVAFFPGEQPVAAAWRVSLERGQVLRVDLEIDPPEGGRVFMDLFRVGGGGSPIRVASAPDGARRLEFEPAGSGDFVLRLQPELLRDLRVRLRVIRRAALAFPVLGRGPRDIGSPFGASREAGRRRHEGVDIFAPRGTPVVAATDGRIARVGTQRLGGLVVWLRDERRGQSHYYAHLDSQLVRRGDSVRAGDTVGLVGNTGNARTTPPHLHFGLYQRGRGSIDPYPYLEAPTQDPPPLRADTSRLGAWVRTTAGTGRGAGAVGVVLPPHSVVRVLGAAARRYRVRSPDGRSWTIASGAVEPLDAPIADIRLAAGEPLLAEPRLRALARGHARKPVSLPVIGRFDAWVLVVDSAGERAWVSAGPR